ncbi:tRNA (adenosine(37)-N6)-threonylcarbamoyltransferase complex dimerization subunit type 1 TsaB [Nafulsella turpanensis]|uniref:tRNA (adenosine(37)-N6)-threonylcarbamoyltransferase complex dimerization subunit type 1 TsaB n=1 Tax=Nafulsella turpanensis TaxID=1265690 RepID=UPI000347ACFA|nr:tRNA (adenosine(37)-N6)-threonylcarbamoyltransferase complex dimerization subunit type 1 TsaB [Nafulsella turpanensis]
MSLLLSIDSATKVCSVALHQDGSLLASQHLHIDKSHSGLLTVLIDHLLQYAGYKMADLSAVAVSEGPGSYTGLRIGASTAKGLCFALDIPLVTINTLEAMAKGMSYFAEEESLFCPMIDARRMEVYCLLATSSAEIVEAPQAKIIDETSFLRELEKQKVYFFGDGSAKCQPLLGRHPNARFIKDVVPSAVYVGELGWQRFKAEKFADVAYFEPDYLKEFYSPKAKGKK